MKLASPATGPQLVPLPWETTSRGISQLAPPITNNPTWPSGKSLFPPHIPLRRSSVDSAAHSTGPCSTVTFESKPRRVALSSAPSRRATTSRPGRLPPSRPGSPAATESPSAAYLKTWPATAWNAPSKLKSPTRYRPNPHRPGHAIANSPSSRNTIRPVVEGRQPLLDGLATDAIRQFQ